MVFSSLLFLTRFLPCVLLVYFIVPGCMKNIWRNLILFVFSLVFYAWGEPIYIWLMLFSTVVDYVNGGLAGYFVERNRKSIARIFLMLSVVINLSLLAVFKYTGKYALPIGISFYTFQSMSYTIDVYRGKAKAEKNIINFGAYISLFPQLIAGPIVRFSDIAVQLRERRADLSRIRYGVVRFSCGLGKKVLLANQAGEIFRTVTGYAATQLTTLAAWFGILAFMFQIYFDFSGYSDMAIGLGEMFGFHFPENFDHPYESKSITEFWRRWHMTLGTWFREYVYIPLGGNRKGLARQVCNLFVVWFLTGLWHGAGWNFILWGLYYFVLLVLEKFVLRRIAPRVPAWLQHLYTMFFVVVGWVIFACDDMTLLGSYFKALFGIGVPVGNALAAYEWDILAPFLIILTLAATTIPVRIAKQIVEPKRRSSFLMVYSMILLFLSLAFLVSGSYNPFLYFRF